MSRAAFLRRWVLAMGVALTLAAPARADTAMSLYKSFSGNVSFSGTQVTIRDRGNKASACAVSAENVSQSASLSLPRLAEVVSAQLYWAGSGTVDSTVALDGKAVSAGRSYSSATIGGGMDYFSASADVTAQVKLKGSGNYTFSGLKVANGRPWCDYSAVMGGYALVVVYSHWNETYRTLNLYEGFRALLNSEVRLDMANFRVPDNVSSSALGRFGHLVWEGDSAISKEGESLWFNNVSLTHSTYAPSGNNFNSKSSINGDERSIGIDFDAYSLGPWPAKLNTVSALFRTGGDMVLLNAAMLAVPSTPAADLAIELVRSNELRVGSTVSYTATVTNQGPGTETGPFTVTLALPAGLSYSSGAGSNWSCTGSGTAATCTYNGALAKDAKAVLTLKAVVSSTGSKTTSVTVKGNNDPDSSDDKDSDTAIVAGAGGISFEYTRRACTAGELVGDGGSCPLFSGPVVAGSTAIIYLTAVDNANKARAPSANKSTDVALSLALGCVNPSSSGGINAYYGGIKLPECVKDSAVATGTTAWKPAGATFAAGQISMKVGFEYFDAGAVKLYVRSESGIIDFVQFVSIPDALKLNVSDAQGNPNPGGVGLAQAGFVRAGEKFSIELKALSAEYTAGGVSKREELPNFGKEEGKLRPKPVNLAKRVDVPASNASGIEENALMGAYPDSGAYLGKEFYWSDIGSFMLQVELGKYLGEDTAAVGKQTVGRFYPAWFTTVAGPGFACLPRMNCPYVGTAAIKEAVYSNQAFGLVIKVHDENGAELPNFSNERFPSLVPDITVSAVDAPGTGLPFAARITPGMADQASKITTRSLKFGLGTQWLASKAALKPLAPTAVYIRASANDKRGAANVKISSVRAEAEQSVEGGIMVVNGRLAIANVSGSELLKTSIPMQAQYWTGSNWENNTSFEHTSLLNTAQAQFTSCQRTLALRGATAPDNCNTALVKPATAGALALAAGTTKLVLAPVGAGQFGSFRIQMKTEEWLPSMFGQVTIGAFRSPVIFIREMY